MKTKHIEGNTAFNDGLLLPEGMISIDSEKKALRFYDGVTVGGFEILGTPAVPILYGPGPEILIGGDMTAGFFGEVTSSELMTYEALASEIGLSAGVSQFNEESLWLKFALEGNILYIAKKSPRHTVSWGDINSVNAVYEGGGQVTVGPHLFDVTCLRGASGDPTIDVSGYDIPTSHGSEWNLLLYPVHSGVHINVNNPTTHTDPSAAPFGSWAQYSDSDLVVTEGTGWRQWCQETIASTTQRVFRGYNGVTHSTFNSLSYAFTNAGWRPVLRLQG